MTQDRLVPGQSGADYWSKDIMDLDAQQKAYRAIPVPVLANENQKHIDARVELELLVEHLATRNDFKIPAPSFHGLSPEDATAAFLQYAEEVQNAPPEEKADAQRSLGGHLKGFGESIRNGLMGGLSKAMGIPGVSQTISAVSFLVKKSQHSYFTTLLNSYLGNKILSEASKSGSKRIQTSLGGKKGS